MRSKFACLSFLFVLGSVCTQGLFPSFAGGELPAPSRSRIAVFAQVGPGVFLEPYARSSQVDAYPTLFSNVGLSVYLFDQCKARKTQTCTELLGHLGFSTETFFLHEANNKPMLGGLVGLEPRFYFGRQRRISWTLQGYLGAASYPGVLRGMVGTGLFVSFPSQGIGLSLQMNYSPNLNYIFHLLYFPLGFHYRF